MRSNATGCIDIEMKKITRRQKKEALSLLNSRQIGDFANHIVGYLEAQAAREVAGERSKTVSSALSEFVQLNHSLIRALPVRTEIR